MSNTNERAELIARQRSVQENGTTAEMRELAKATADMLEADGDIRTVRITKAGLSFGNAWISHERITGENADSLNAGGSGIVARAYMKWMNSAPAHNQQAQVAVPVPPCWYIEYESHGQVTLRKDEADGAFENGAIRVTAYISEAAQQVAVPAPMSDGEWRKLALQFDGQRMQALAHLRAMTLNPHAHMAEAMKFLAAPPTKAQQVAVPETFVELPVAFGEIQYQRPSGQWGRIEGYTRNQMREAVAAAVAKTEAKQAQQVAVPAKEEPFALMYMGLSDAMGYTTGKDDMEYSPEEWAESLLKDATAFRDTAQQVAVPVPPCWYIEYESHGQVTLRKDEADGAFENGAIRVTAYISEAAQQVAVPVPMSDDQAMALWNRLPDDGGAFPDFLEAVKAVEAHHKIGANPVTKQQAAPRQEPSTAMMYKISAARSVYRDYKDVQCAFDYLEALIAADPPDSTPTDWSAA